MGKKRQSPIYELPCKVVYSTKTMAKPRFRVGDKVKVIGTLPITFAPGVKDELGTELGRCSVQRYGVYVKRLPVLLFLLFWATTIGAQTRSEEHTSELQSP